MQADVTIGIPVYKAVDYIRKTVESSLAQTYPNIELLIVDDRGEDGTMAVIKDLQKTHPRGHAIRILQNTENKGVGPSRNRLIDEAQGKYLYFLDSDDVIEPDTIQVLANAMVENHADVVYGSYEKVDNVNHNPTQVFQYSYQRFSEPDEFATYAFMNYGHFQTIVCNCLMDVGFIRKSKLRFIDAMFWEDMAFTYDMVTKVRRGVLLPNITYHYLCRPHSLSNYQDREKLDKEEILKNASTIDYLKWKSYKLRAKPYVDYFCHNLQMNSFYIVCHVLKYRRRIVPQISNKELRHVMRHPMPLSEILHFRHKRLTNCALWVVAHLPIPLFMLVVKCVGKMKKVL